MYNLIYDLCIRKSINPSIYLPCVYIYKQTSLTGLTCPPAALHAHTQRSPPLACILGISRLYFTCTPPVSHHILGTPLYLYIDLYLAMLQQIHCIPLYPTASRCIRTYLAVSSCIPLYLTVSHRLENGIWPKIHSRGGLIHATLAWPFNACK